MAPALSQDDRQRHGGHIRSDPGDVRDRRLAGVRLLERRAIGVTVLVTGVVFWLAHVYARVLAGSIASHRMLNRSEVRDALRHDWPLVEVTVPLVLILALGALDVVPDKTAILAATLAALVELAAAGAYGARTSGAGLRWTVVSAVIAVSLGSAVVLLKALVH